jgi:hypothetical protein
MFSVFDFKRMGDIALCTYSVLWIVLQGNIGISGSKIG